MAQTLNAFIDPSVPDVIKERRMIDVATLPPHKVAWWRPIVTVGDDPFDSATHKKTGPVTTIEPTRVVDTYTVAAFTAQEISDQKDAVVVGFEFNKITFEIAFNLDNRLRVLEGQPPRTRAQFRAILRSLL